jgi:hypothetical protein
MARIQFTYADACRDPHIFGPWFSADSWSTWSVLDRAIFGEPLTADQLVVFTELTGRTEVPTSPVSEAWIIAGRRSGKDVKAASIVVYIATIGNLTLKFHEKLTPGEVGVVQLLAVDRKQAQICLGYIKAMFQQPKLAGLVKKELPDGIELKNKLVIEVTTNDKRRVRGRTVVACVMDEVAFWLSSDTGSVSPDSEVYNALKPAMATMPGAMLIGISSPYAQRGLLFSKYKRHFAKNDPDILIAKAPTWRMNPTLQRYSGFIATAFDEDPQAASAEYGAEFRTDVAGFVSYETIDDATDHHVREREPQSYTAYHAFCDPSGGSSDAMTLAIAHTALLPVPPAHRDDRTETQSITILDCLREVKPPFKPTDVVAQFCLTLKAYGLTHVTGDRYAGEWVVSAFAEHGIIYEHSSLTRSEIYLDLLPRLNSGSVRLLDNKTLKSQLSNLERRTSRTGRDTVDHSPGAHDDLANAAAGALVLAGVGAFDTRDTDIFTFSLSTHSSRRSSRLMGFVPTPDDQFAARYDID